MTYETDWAKINRGFYLRHEYHPGLAQGQGGHVFFLCLKTNDEPPHEQINVPAHSDSWRPLRGEYPFWVWAKENMQIFDAIPRVTYSEK